MITASTCGRPAAPSTNVSVLRDFACSFSLKLFIFSVHRENPVQRQIKQSDAEMSYGLEGKDPEQGDPQGPVQGEPFRREWKLFVA